MLPVVTQADSFVAFPLYVGSVAAYFLCIKSIISTTLSGSRSVSHLCDDKSLWAFVLLETAEVLYLTVQTLREAANLCVLNPCVLKAAFFWEPLAVNSSQLSDISQAALGVFIFNASWWSPSHAVIFGSFFVASLFYLRPLRLHRLSPD